MPRHRKDKRARRKSKLATPYEARGRYISVDGVRYDLVEPIVELSDAERFSERKLRGRDLDLWAPPTPEEALAEKELHEAVLRQLQTLTPREAYLLKHRFGISTPSETRQPHTYEDVAKDFEVSRERIRQLEGKALRKLRHPSRAQHLRSYLTDADLARVRVERECREQEEAARLVEARRADEHRAELQRWQQDQERAWAAARAADERRARYAELRRKVDEWLREYTDWADPKRQSVNEKRRTERLFSVGQPDDPGGCTTRAAAFQHFRDMTVSDITFDMFCRYLRDAYVDGGKYGLYFSIKDVASPPRSRRALGTRGRFAATAHANCREAGICVEPVPPNERCNPRAK